MEYTKAGNKIKRGFSFAGCAGTEGNIVDALFKKGYTFLYSPAPYKFAMVNIKTLKIYTYTEGDICLISCKDINSFNKEILRYYKFEKEMGDGCDMSIKNFIEVNKLYIPQINKDFY